MPVQYGLLRSEKVRSVFRSIYSLATLGSRGSRGSGGSRASRISRRSGGRPYRLRDTAPDDKNDTQSSEVDIPLPVHAAATAGHDPHISDLEMERMQSKQGIMVTKSFDTSDHAV